VASLMDAVPSGSYLALSHLGPEFLDPDALRETEDVSGRMIQQQMTWRNREQVARFFAATDLVEPGLVRVEEWRAEPGTGEAGRSALWSGAGRKR
jgi:S-adenosyl methyltransferase